MKLSIITVVKNDVKNISNTIASVVSQTDKKFEYIVLDGKSNDGTYKKLKFLKKKYNFKLLSYKDKNFYDGLNKAIKYSKGEYIGILNSGDIYFSKNVIKKVLIFLQNEYDLVYSNILYFSGNKIVRRWKKKVLKNDFTEYFKIPHTSAFIKKKLIRKNNYYSTDYKISSDFDLLLKICNKNTKIGYLNKNLIYMKKGGLSTNLQYLLLKTREDLNILRKYFKYKFIFYYFYKILIKITDVFSSKDLDKINFKRKIANLKD